MKQFLFIALILSLGYQAFPQLQPLLDQHYLNGLAINPAYAGSQDALSLGIYARNQWVGFEGAPNTYTFTVHSPMRNKKVNLGLIILGDQIGSKKETGFIFNYAYRIELGKGKVSLGLAAGLSHITSNINDIRFMSSGDPLLQDPSGRVVLPDFSLGAYYHTAQYYLGLSMPLFLSHPTKTSSGSYGIGLNMAEATYMLTGGYLFKLSETFELLSSALIRINPANASQLDLHCDLIYKKTVLLGTSLRTNGNLSSLLQVQVNQQLRVGYCYSYEFSELSTVQYGSHELILCYSFKYILDVQSPRYF